MNTILKSVVIFSALSITALPFSATMAEEAAAKKPAKEISCKQEAKNQGIKDKAEKKAFVKQCEEKRKAAHSK